MPKEKTTEDRVQKFLDDYQKAAEKHKLDFVPQVSCRSRVLRSIIRLFGSQKLEAHLQVFDRKTQQLVNLSRK